MQTIIYTDCKRVAANYEVDKICFADRVDISQLIEDEMNKYNIQHIHFWLITKNINYIEGCSDEKILIHTGKYLVENKDMSFVLEYLVQKYTLADNKPDNKPSKRESLCVSQRQNTRKKSTLLSQQSNLQLASTAMSKFSKGSEEKPNSKSRYLRQQLVNQTIKFESFAQFQSFIQRQIKYCVDKQAIKTYIFKTKTETISFSFIEGDKKQLIKTIIQLDCDKIYDAKLNMTKKSTFQLFNNHEHQIKKFNKHMAITHTLYNKIILFLFNDNKPDEFNRTRKKLKYCSGNKQNPSIVALAEWKIKEQNVDILTKLQKECQLIKREIQNERILFRNKIKAIQNYIGDTINIEKLVQQQDEVPSNNQLPNSSKAKTPFFKKTQQTKKDSINAAQLDALNNISKIGTNNSSFITTQFKRLKDISDAMRNIDNTLFEQNKKIETSKVTLKQLIKSKEALIYANARQLNKIKSQIVGGRNQIERKQLQIKEKKKNGTFQQIAQYKNRQPTKIALQKLQKYKDFVYNITSNNQSLDNSQRKDEKNNGQSVKAKVVNKQAHRSLHDKVSNFKQANKHYKQKLLKEVQQCALSYNRKREDHLKLIKKITKKQMSIDQLQGQTNQISAIQQVQLQYKNIIIKKELFVLYQYYLENQEIINSIHSEIEAYKEIPQIQMNTFVKNVSHHQSVQKTKYDRTFFSQMKQLQQIYELKQKDFPILNDYAKSVKMNKENIQKKQFQKTSAVNSKNFHQVSRFPKNCFQMLTGCVTKKKPEKVQTHQTTESIKSEFYDKVAQSMDNRRRQEEVKSIKSIPKLKRTTIEQAISLNSSLFPKKQK